MSLNVQLYPDANSPAWLPQSNVAYNNGDLCYNSGAGGIILPAGQQASQGSEAADQILFASKFAGIIVSGASAAQTLANSNTPLTIDQGQRVWLCSCPSQTWNHGDLVGIYSTGSLPPDPQQVDACGGNPTRAIGRVFGYYPNAVTQVQVVFDARNFVDVGGSGTRALTLLTTNGAIAPHTIANYVITKAGVLAMTLAAPTAGTDDGLIITITSDTANAHTVTATGLFGTGTSSVNLATFAAQLGSGFAIMAYNAKWLVLYSVGITFS